MEENEQKKKKKEPKASEKNENWMPITEDKEYDDYLKTDKLEMSSHLPQEDLKNHNPYEPFQLFFTDELFQHVVDSTQHYRTKVKDNTARRTVAVKHAHKYCK